MLGSPNYMFQYLASYNLLRKDNCKNLAPDKKDIIKYKTWTIKNKSLRIHSPNGKLQYEGNEKSVVEFVSNNEASTVNIMKINKGLVNNP